MKKTGGWLSRFETGFSQNETGKSQNETVLYHYEIVTPLNSLSCNELAVLYYIIV